MNRKEAWADSSSTHPATTASLDLYAKYVDYDGDANEVDQNAADGLSPIEQIYDHHIAEEKMKHGTKFEQLTALVFKVLDGDSSVKHNVRLRGDGKTTIHQIDVHIMKGDLRERMIIECRDKTEPNKISLDETRSFATVVRHLDATGIMVTTTDFTAGAHSLAEDEGLLLFTLKPFLDEDQEGRLMVIDLDIRAVMPIPDNVQVESPESGVGHQAISMDSAVISGSSAPTFRHVLESFMDAPLQGDVPEGQQTTERAFDPPLVIDLQGHLLTITRMRVDYHVEVEVIKQRVDAGMKVAEMILRSTDGNIDRVIWDTDLSRYCIDPNSGDVIRRHLRD
jgi:hypothetical protein